MVVQAVCSGDPSPAVPSMLQLMALQECRAEFQKHGLNFGSGMEIALRNSAVR